MKQKIFDLLEPSDTDTLGDKIVNWSMIGLVLINVFVMTLESVSHHRAYEIIEIVTGAIFLVEYLLRVWSSSVLPQGRWRYVRSPMMIFDLLSLVSFLTPANLIVLRLFRLLKICRYSKSFQLFATVFKARKHELFFTGGIMTIILLASATVMFQMEHEAQPDKFPNIVAALWWAIATMTTIGYGDIFPITPGGKMFAGLFAIVGISFFALPTGLFCATFLDELQKRRKPTCCPHCQKEL